MKIKDRTPPVSVVVHVHISNSRDESSKPPIEQKTVDVVAEDTAKSLGIFKPRIDHGYTVDAKFFNDQVKNTISLSVVAIAGIALLRSETCDYFEKFGGISLIAFSLWLMAINVGQTLQALGAIWKSKWGEQKSLKLVLVTISLVVILLSVFWGMIGLWKHGFSNINFLNIPDVCKLSTKNQSGQAK